MAGEIRMSRTTGTRGVRVSKQLASSTCASAPLKRHAPVPGMKETTAKSPSTSSSDSGCEKKGLHGRKTSIRKKDAREDATASCSESSVETSNSEFQASNQLSSEGIEPDETDHNVTDVAPPDTELDLKDSLDVDDSNLAVSWFSVGALELDGFLNTKTDRNLETTGSMKQSSIRPAATAADSPGAVLELSKEVTATATSNPGALNDEFEGEICRVSSINTLTQGKLEFEGIPPDVKELSIKTPGAIMSPKTTNSKYTDGLATSETSKETSDANGQQDHKHDAKAYGNLMGHVGYAIAVSRGWRAVVIACLLFLLMFWCYVDILIGDGVYMLPPPT